MLRKVKLYGELADFIGYTELDAVINNPAEAIRFLVTNFPKLEAHMSDKYYKVLVGENNIDKNEILYPIGKSDVHIVPVIVGSGGGVGKILAGGALIALTVATGGFGGATIGTFGLGAGTIGVGKLAVGVGAALALSGVSELLFPMPKPVSFDPEDDPRISFSFSGIQNTSRAGTPIPIVYGEILTGSVVISAGVDTNQIP